MLQERPQQRGVGADFQDTQVSLHGEFVKLERREIGEGVAFGVAPDQLDGVEFWGIGGAAARRGCDADCVRAIL